MPNRLEHENSPYLLQHKDNPVDWYPWGEAALSRAREDDKPIFLSIGYAACHWCHVMERESFEDPETAELMNSHFINIKVDREERPDLDTIYMKSVVALTGQGGWPMSVWLTPEGVPFYGGTYFPPVRRYNMPSFREILSGVANLWTVNPARARESGKQLLDHIQGEFEGMRQSLVDGDQVSFSATGTQALEKIEDQYDWAHGGWGQAPKFPQPMTIEYLLRMASRGDQNALRIAVHALDSMAQGGMYDLIGGGFSRYSVDNDWLIPHFEKMLYDNAQLSLVYLYGYLLSGSNRYREIVEETLEFTEHEMTHPSGGFYSSLDADSEGVEGKFYVWDRSEIEKTLASKSDFEWLAAIYDLKPEGNFEGKIILRQLKSPEDIAAKTGKSAAEVKKRLGELQKKLFTARSMRARPLTDDKVLTGWNALMAFSFSEAGRYLGKTEYAEMAMRNLDFLIENMLVDQRLYRSWRDTGPESQAKNNAYLEDYAALILALLSVYQSDPNPKWFATAQHLAEQMIALFAKESGGFFDTGADHEILIARPHDIQDNAIPSGNSLATSALLQLAAIHGEGSYRDLAELNLKGIIPYLSRYPSAFGKWLCALDFAAGPVREIAILGANTPARTDLWHAAWAKYQPRQVVAVSSFPPSAGSPGLLQNRPLKDDQPTAYVCQDFFCKKPVNTTEDLIKELE